MKAFLMFRDRDFDPEAASPANQAELIKDLELRLILRAMANGDAFLVNIACTALLVGLTDPAAIRYRQQVLEDCLSRVEVVRELYGIAVQAIEEERKIIVGFFRDSPDSMLRRAVQVMEMFLTKLQQVRAVADKQGAVFQSEGFTRFFQMISTELDDAYLASVETHLKELTLDRGVLMNVQLGQANKGENYVLQHSRRESLLERIGIAEKGYSFRIADRDIGGHRALSDLRDQAINDVADALARSADHILSFFVMVRAELAFYVGCLNLRQQLAARGQGVAFPVPEAAGTAVLTAEGLYDASLALMTDKAVVGNNVGVDGKRLIIVTGANQGGKSTFLRSIGQAHLMMQAGMFVAAGEYRGTISRSVFTHFKREEDAGMESGKLDEELARLSAIVDAITPGSLLLSNESFAATNEREGSEIGRRVIRALVDEGVTVIAVTHLFDLASGFYREQLPEAVFLRAERLPDGERTYRIVPGEPLPTSFGRDAYERIFGPDHA